MNNNTGHSRRGGMKPGVSKPQRWAKETSGIRWVRLETYADVKRACDAFLMDRIARGLMKDWRYGFYEGKLAVPWTPSVVGMMVAEGPSEGDFVEEEFLTKEDVAYE